MPQGQFVCDALLISVMSLPIIVGLFSGFVEPAACSSVPQERPLLRMRRAVRRRRGW